MCSLISHYDSIQLPREAFVFAVHSSKFRYFQDLCICNLAGVWFVLKVQSLNVVEPAERVDLCIQVPVCVHVIKSSCSLLPSHPAQLVLLSLSRVYGSGKANRGQM